MNEVTTVTVGGRELDAPEAAPMGWHWPTFGDVTFAGASEAGNVASYLVIDAPASATELAASYGAAGLAGALVGDGRTGMLAGLAGGMFGGLGLLASLVLAPSGKRTETLIASGAGLAASLVASRAVRGS